MIDHVASVLPDDQLYEQLGVRFDRKTLADVVAIALEDISSPVLYVTCNLNHLRVLQSDREFQDAYRKARLITLDSRPIQMASRLRYREHLPVVTGAELFASLFERLRPGRDRPFFVTSSDETGMSLRQRLIDRGFAAEAVGYYSPPFGFQADTVRTQAMLDQIGAHGTTHLFMGVGAPKSERWVAEHFDALPPAHVFCVGAALDFTAGSKNRAPAWLGYLGFEWLHRLLSEPSRLMPRYAGDVAVLVKVLRGKRLARISPPAASFTTDRIAQ